MSEKPPAAAAVPTPVETVIIGAGPVGLFQIFELGLLGISAHIIDSLPQAGGQCTELYPDKPIYDIPALPICGAQELVDRLLEQAKPFHATFHLGQEVTEMRPLDGGKFHVATSTGTRLIAGAVVIAAGVGSFQPRRLALPGVEEFEGKSVHYRVKAATDFHGRDLLICGGGDSALDWTVALGERARSLTLLHRRAEFRAAPATVARMHDLVRAGKMQVLAGNAVGLRRDNDKLLGLDVRTTDGRDLQLSGEQVLVFYGLHPKLGPIAEWGMELEKRALKVDTEKFQTSVPGIFAVGDINSYPGKKKLILSGFHEAALAAFAIQHHLFPEKRQFLQYTTTSPIMQKRLGVTATETDSNSGGI
ncbi:MAG TPA: NAD(P)/FAD-dependent oxidoreductase [Steroidobacteraceae bacterium]|jgi:thioredoxin reductase (NADPH)|nr:NAD(P)/FAD-dependent oxidoreductase [Steroidobacteraceae bacterium]